MVVVTTASPGQRAARAQVEGADREDLVAVHGRAGGVHRQGAVAVAVEGEAEVGAAAAHDRRRQQRRGRSSRSRR